MVVRGSACRAAIWTSRRSTPASSIKAARVSRLDFPHARPAIKITRWRKDTAAGKATRQAVYAVTSLTSADATAADLDRLVREHWSIEAHHHVRSDLSFGEDASASRTGSGPANLATIRAAVIAALKHAGYLHIPEGRRDHTTPAETLRLHGLDQGQIRTFTEHAGALVPTCSRPNGPRRLRRIRPAPGDHPPAAAADGTDPLRVLPDPRF